MAVIPGGVNGCAAFGPCPAGACSDDAVTATSVRTVLAEHKEFLPGSIQVLVHARVVYLYGIAETDLERFHAESIARSTSGVTRVVDFIGVSNR